MGKKENIKKMQEIIKEIYNTVDEETEVEKIEEEPIVVEYSIIKNLIQEIPEENYKYLDEDGKKIVDAPQRVVDEAYEAMVQDLMSTIDCKVFYDAPTIKFKRKQFKDFLNGTLDTDRLQTNNILISNDLWKRAMLSQKKAVMSGYFQRSVDDEKYRVNYSEISVKKAGRGLSASLPVLTTIQFDNVENPDATLVPIDYTAKAREKFERLFSVYSRARDVDAIYEMAELSQDFSIHNYYMPSGLDGLDDCCLLLRYDHCSGKHYNGAMPKLYKKVYPDFVEEPHFHFNSGFGAVYKLSSKNPGNYGVGYAIGISGLRTYLDTLYSGNFKDKQQEKLFMKNDFGMPFLYYKLADVENGTNYLGEIVEGIKMLQLNEAIAGADSALETAYNFVRLISGLSSKDLKCKFSEDIDECDNRRQV